MIDLLFSIYYSFFKNSGERGARAAVNLLTIHLSLIVYTSLLFVSSFVIRVADLGTVFFVLGAIAVGVFINYYFTNRYVTGKGYEKIIVRYPLLSYLLAILFYLLAIIVFPVMGFVLLSE